MNGLDTIIRDNRRAVLRELEDAVRDGNNELALRIARANLDICNNALVRRVLLGTTPVSALQDVA